MKHLFVYFLSVSFEQILSRKEGGFKTKRMRENSQKYFYRKGKDELWVYVGSTCLSKE